MISTNKHAVIIEGPPLSGKDTQARILAESYGYYHFNCGEILRNKKELKRYTDHGLMVPDDVTIGIVFDELPKHLPDRMVITGFPRSLGQAKWLKGHLGADSYRTSVILIDVPKKTIEERLTVRMQQEKRSDDNQATLPTRLRRYENYGPLVRDFFKETNHHIHRVPIGNASSAQVWLQIERFVKEELECFQLTEKLEKKGVLIHS